MLYVVAYFTTLIELLITLYACHQGPHGVRGTWRDLGRQLVFRRSTIPVAYLVKAACSPRNQGGSI